MIDAIVIQILKNQNKIMQELNETTIHEHGNFCEQGIGSYNTLKYSLGNFEKEIKENERIMRMLELTRRNIDTEYKHKFNDLKDVIVNLNSEVQDKAQTDIILQALKKIEMR